MVGRKQVHAYRLADGKAAWDGRTVDLPEGALPSGRGFLSDDKYYLPLNSAEVAAIDLNAGKIERISKSQKGDIPGNLVCYKGRILSQNYRGLEVFYQLDAAMAEVADRLAANPRDAEAFCLRGEILLDAGNRAEAVDCYRKAYRNRRRAAHETAAARFAAGRLAAGIRRLSFPRRGDRKAVGKFPAAGGLFAADDRRLAKGGRNRSRLSTNANR